MCKQVFIGKLTALYFHDIENRNVEGTPRGFLFIINENLFDWFFHSRLWIYAIFIIKILNFKVLAEALTFKFDKLTIMYIYWFANCRYIESSQMSSLKEVFISKANGKQRQGRAGRVREGFCFRLYTHQKLVIF